MRGRVLFALLGFVLLLTNSCSDDNTGVNGGGMVTIAGVVRSIDDGSLAEGVLIRQLDTDYVDEVATGSDGKYELRVPKGTKLLLHADDDPASGQDKWFPFINVDIPSVVVNDDSVPFNRDGKNVFAHFVLDCDPEIIPGDEVMVVDGEDRLVAVGSARMAAREMKDFGGGMAVDVREGCPPE